VLSDLRLVDCVEHLTSHPAVVVSGRCTNETPFETKSPILAELFDQVNQNAERMTLLATAKPFVMWAATWLSSDTSTDSPCE
jgi:hypothetical protein